MRRAMSQSPDIYLSIRTIHEYEKASKYPVFVDHPFLVQVCTCSDIDYTVKVEATNMEPYTKYFKSPNTLADTG
jgi:hypothetical protein